MSPKFTRASGLVAAGALAVTSLGAVAAPAHAAPPDPRPLSIAAGWLEGELTDGLLHNSQFDFDDVGLTIDAGLSLAAIGGREATVEAIADALAPKILAGYAESDEYAFTEPYDFIQVGYYAGATAKSLVFAQVAGEDPETWAGEDLVAALEARVTTSGPSTGRIADDSSYGDYANTIGQAFAARGLSAESSSAAGDVVGFLLDQQCSAGYFRLDFTADAGAPDQSCDGGAGEPDTDATALAVLQLTALSAPSQPVTDAVAAAEAWLLAEQRQDGSFGGGTSTEAPNTNSTGLAGWALGALGEESAATRAAGWIRRHQADEVGTCSNALSGETGALGYNKEAVTAALAEGITTATEDQWRRATAPTLPALAWAPAGGNLDVDGPHRYVRGGARIGYTLSDGAPGAKVCVSAPGGKQRVVLNSAGGNRFAATMPNRTVDRVISARTTGQTTSILTEVLGPRKLTVRAKARPVRGKKLTVRVLGLEPAEKAQIRFRGKRKRAGTANARGVFAATFTVRGKLGKAVIKGAGQFPAKRSGIKRARVVR